MPLEIVDEYRDSAFARAQTGLLFNLPAPPPEREQLPAGISLCMIVKNEERFLAECLASVRDVVDEINIVDTGSTDRTVEIAREFGANVIFREWRNDFAWARNEALAMAARRWTLVLDADEEIAPESLPLLHAIRETPADLTAVYVRIMNLVDDASGGATMTHVLARLFPTTSRIRYRNVIHEGLVVDGKTHVVSVISPILVRHKGYTAAMMDARAKNERNKPLLESAIRDAADDAFSWFNFGVAAITAGDHEGGIAALERMFAMEGEPRAFFPVAFVMLAIGYVDGRRDIERATELLDEGLAMFPGHPNMLFTRGYVLSQAECYEEARTWYEQSIAAAFDAGRHAMVDDEIWTWKAAMSIAATFVKEGRVEDSIPWYERAYERKSDSLTLRGVMAKAYEAVRRYYDAERLFREAADRDGETGFVGYVNYLMRRRRFGEAFDRIDRRRDAVDDRAYAALLLSAATVTREARLGDPEPYAVRALALTPGNGLVLGLLDAHYAALGETAKRDALRAAELDAPLVDQPDFARRSFRLLEERRPADALAAALAGLEAFPEDGVLAYNAALAAARVGRDADALRYLERIAPDHQHATAALALRAEIERRAGDLDAAIATLGRVRTLPAPDEMVLRTATVGLAGALLEAGRVADAGKLAAFVLN